MEGQGGGVSGMEISMEIRLRYAEANARHPCLD